MIYKVEMITTLLVEADSESEANIIAFTNLENEAKNGTSHWHTCTPITDRSMLNVDELLSLPWRHYSKRDEPELSISDLLED